MGYEFVVVFQGNVEQFEKTVSSITGQITDEDRITVIGTGSLSEVKSLKALKKNKKAVHYRHADTVQAGYNLTVEESSSEFMVFMHEGDWLGPDFVRTTSEVYSGHIPQVIPVTEGEDADPVVQIMNPDQIQVLFVKNYCDNSLISETPQLNALSKASVKGTYGIDLETRYWALQTSLSGAVIRTSCLKKYKFNDKIQFEYETDIILRILNDEKRYHQA